MEELTIPEEHHKLIRTALKKATGQTEWDEITPLTRGMSGASIYKVKAKEHFYVARIGHQKNHWSNNLNTEYTNIQIASNAEVSPHVYYADPVSEIILMKYIDSNAQNKLGKGDKHEVQSLAKLISRMHHCTEFSSGSSFLQITQGLLETLSSQYNTHSLVSQASELLESLEKRLSDPTDLRPSHRDINPYNLLFDGNDFYLIDWEASAQDSLYLDLATCINFYFYNNADAAHNFLEQYFGNELSEKQEYKLHLMRIVVFIYSGTCLLSMASSSEPKSLSTEKINQLPSYDEYMQLIANASKNLGEPSVQQEYGFVCFKQMLSLMQHPDYAAAMEKLGT